jgi:hypothetical protein
VTAAAAPAGGEENEEERKNKLPLRNQFNFSERAAQTVNNPFRVRFTSFNLISRLKKLKKLSRNALRIPIHLL